MATTLTEILGNSGAPLSFEHEGRTYTVSKIDQKKKSQHEQWIAEQAIKVEETYLRIARLRWQESGAKLALVRERIAKEKLAKADTSATEIELAEIEREFQDDDGMLEEARDSMRKVKDRLTAGEGKFGGTLWVMSLSTVNGVVKMVSLLIGLPEYDALMLFGEAKEKIEPLIELAIQQSFPKALMARGAGPPKAEPLPVA